MALGSAQCWPSPAWCSGQWAHPLTGQGLGQAHAFPGGLTDVGMMEEPVDGRGGEGLGHQLIEGSGMEVGGERDGAFLVGGIDQSVQALGGVGSHREQADVVDDDQVRSKDPGDGLGDGVVGSVAAQQDPEVLEMAQAVTLAKLFNPKDVDWALGHAAVHARFAEADLASILDHHHTRTADANGTTHRAGEERS